MDADALEESVASVNFSIQFTERLGDNARALFKSQFSAAHVYSEMIDHLETLLAAKSTPT